MDLALYTNYYDAPAAFVIARRSLGIACGARAVRLSRRGIPRVCAMPARFSARSGGRRLPGAQPRDRQAHVGGSHSRTAAVGAAGVLETGGWRTPAHAAECAHRGFVRARGL